MKTYSFEKLIVWQKSKMLTVNIYKLTSTFPKEELFGISNQMRRSSVSIVSRSRKLFRNQNADRRDNIYVRRFKKITDKKRRLRRLVASYPMNS
jgi:four helix bundle protein